MGISCKQITKILKGGFSDFLFAVGAETLRAVPGLPGFFSQGGLRIFPYPCSQDFYHFIPAYFPTFTKFIRTVGKSYLAEVKNLVLRHWFWIVNPLPFPHIMSGPKGLIEYRILQCPFNAAKILDTGLKSC